ncbi:MAG: hypothetical protein ACPGEG_08215 [Salibacteraceae bacterium]
MRIIVSLLFVLFFNASYAQTTTDEWVSLEDGIDYKWVSKKKVKNTEYSILKLKVRNSTSATKQVSFTIYEYKGVTATSRSGEESFCLKPGLMDVIKVQMIETSADNLDADLLLEFSDLTIKEVESCPGK